MVPTSCRICKQITTLHYGACQTCIDRGLELVEKENREFEAMDEWNTREEREYAIAHGFDPFGSIAYDEWWRTHNATDIGPSERCGSQSYQEWAEALPVSSEPVPF